MEKVYWMDEMTWPEFAELVKETDIAIIPVGAIEEHSLHAPMGTDTFIAEELAKRIARKVKAISYPSIRICHGVEGFDTTMWPGTINISAETMINVYKEVGEELVRHGLRRLLFVNGHSNNSSCLGIAAFKIWKETGAAVGIFEWWVAMREEVRKHTDCAHADQVETSLLLATEKANLVRRERGVANPSPSPVFEEEKFLSDRGMSSKITRAYDERYLYRGGFGNTTRATKELGSKLLDGSVELALRMLEALKKHVNDKKIKGYRDLQSC